MRGQLIEREEIIGILVMTKFVINDRRVHNIGIKDLLYDMDNSSLYIGYTIRVH